MVRESQGAQLIDAGYVVVVPDAFWRVQPGCWGPRTEEGVQQSMAMANRFFSGVVSEQVEADLGASLQHLRGLTEVDEWRVATMGYCLGGTLAFVVASRRPGCARQLLRVRRSGSLDRADAVRCPALFHFGGSDPSISDDDVVAVTERFAGRPT